MWRPTTHAPNPTRLKTARSSIACEKRRDVLGEISNLLSFACPARESHASTYTVPSNYPDMSARLLPGGYENKENLAEHEANWQIRS